jgi:hypothetical protein
MQVWILFEHIKRADFVKSYLKLVTLFEGRTQKKMNEKPSISDSLKVGVRQSFLFATLNRYSLGQGEAICFGLL